MRITRLSRVHLALLAGALATVGAFGQENYGTILGSVLDQSGAGVPGAKLSAASPTLPQPIEVESDSSGRYNMGRMPVGIYTITVTKSGFTTVKQTNVDVKLGSSITLNPTLRVSNVAETVEVTESAVSIDPTSSRTQVNISSQVFDNLPRSRSFESILTMAPGVRLEPKASSGTTGNAGRTTGIQVDGASGSENQFVIDGVDVSDVRRGTLRTNSAIPFEFISDVQVKSAGMEADSGGATGGVVNIATRSGTNDFHGQLLYQVTSDVFNPRPRGFWKLSPFSADRADFFAPKEDEYTTQYPGFMLGGPLIKNRLFFNAGYMPVLEHRVRNVSYTTLQQAPNGFRTFRQDLKQHFSLMRVDYNPLAKLQINTSWIWSPVKQVGALASQEGRAASPPSNDLSIQGGYQPSQQYSAAATYTFSSRLLASARYGYRYQNDKLGNYGLSGAPFISYSTASPSDVPLPGGAGFSNVSSTLAIQYDKTTRHNVYLDGSYLSGAHTLKFGYALNRLSNEVNTDYTNGRFQIFWGQAFSRGQINNQQGALGYYVWQDGVRQNNGANSRNQGFYVNDNWRAGKRLTLNLGVRFENEFLPPFTRQFNGRDVGNPISFGWGSKIAPRLGAAWDVLGDGKWKLSGSFGLYYDTMKYELARGSFGGDYWWTYVYKLDNANVLNLGKATPGALGAEITRYNNRSLPINQATGAWEGVDPDMKPYTQREFTVRLDHALSSRLTATLRYSRKQLLRVIEDIGVLDSEGSEQYVIGNPGFGLTRVDPTGVYNGKAPSGEFLVPKAKRDYDGIEFRVQGQLTRTTYMLASYTYSRLFGNYSGLANSDENGRSDPGVSRAFDLPYYYFNSKGQNAEGRLATDRPHAITFFGSQDVKWMGGVTNIGLSQVAFSGTPLSTQMIYISAPTFPNGRGDLGRTPFYTQTDVTLKHTIKVSERVTIAPEAYFTNIFNQNAVLNTQQTINRAGAVTDTALPLSRFFAGYNVNDFVNPSNPLGTAAPYSPIYKLPISYQTPREVRLGLRIIF
ncbi:Oar protein [Bryobacterales bacterium F-183]|nr:Oar protein [Bryobacterales bacterium F-183]